MQTYFPFFLSDNMESKYDDEDFGDLLLNVHSVPKKDSVVDRFPEFGRYSKFHLNGPVRVGRRATPSRRGGG